MESVGHVHYPNKEVLGLIWIVWAGYNISSSVIILILSFIIDISVQKTFSQLKVLTYMHVIRMSALETDCTCWLLL